MKSLKLVAVAAVMSWAAFNGEEASAQVYYGYPTVTSQYRSYAPTSQGCGYRVPSGYRNNRVYPVGVPSSLYQSNSIPPRQYGRPGYSYPQPGYGVPVNRPVFPGAGQFSVEDRFLASPTTTQQGVTPATLPASLTNSPYYQNPGTIVPTGGYAPTRNYPPRPVISAPTNNSPFYR